MSGDALRVLFAELGFEVDESGLKKADAMARDLAARITAAWEATGAGGEGAKAALAGLASVQRDIAAGFDELAHAAEAALPSIVLDEDFQAQADSLARVTDEVKRLGKTAQDEQEKAAAASQFAASTEGQAHAAWKRREEEKRRAAAPYERARGERADHAAQQSFNASAEGQAHAAWQRQVENARAMQAPVTGLAGIADRTSRRVTDAFGRAMPTAVERFAASLGIARGDTLALGQVVLDVSRRASMGLAALAVGIGVFTTSFAAESEALRETAREARVTSSELQALQHAGAQSGVGADRVTQSVTALGQKLRDANNHLPGSGGTVHMLRRLGITARDASGQIRPTVDILDDVAVAMEHVSSPRRRIRIAEALGLDRRMLDILHTGEGGIRALREEMQALGGGVTPEATEAARRFTQQQERMRVALTSVRSSIFAQLAPSLEGLMQKVSVVVGWFARVTRGSHFFEHAVRNLGLVLAVAAVPALAAWSPLTLTFGAVAAAALLVALAFDDIQNLLEGHNSLIGEMIDRYAGAGTAARWVQQLRDAWNGVVDAMVRLNEAVSLMPPWARRMFDVGTLGVRHLFGNERMQGGAAAPGGASAHVPAAPPAPAAQQGIPAANLAAWIASRPAFVPPVVPSAHVVPMPRAGGTTVQQTTHHAGDRINVTINGDDPAAMRRELLRLLEERERRRNNERSPREGA